MYCIYIYTVLYRHKFLAASSRGQLSVSLGWLDSLALHTPTPEQHQSRMLNVFLLVSAGVVTTGALGAIHTFFIATNQVSPVMCVVVSSTLVLLL